MVSFKASLSVMFRRGSTSRGWEQVRSTVRQTWGLIVKTSVCKHWSPHRCKHHTAPHPVGPRSTSGRGAPAMLSSASVEQLPLYGSPDIYMYVHDIYIYTHTHTHVHTWQKGKRRQLPAVRCHVCMHVCMYVCMYMHAWMHVCMYVCMYAYNR